MRYQFENQGSSIYLVAELPEEAVVDTMTLGMITNNAIPGVAYGIYTQLDTTKYVKYNITAKVSLKQLLEGAVNRHRLVGVFLGICNALQNAEDYMLDRGSFLYDADKIFVNVSTLEVSLICVPVMNLVQNVPDVGMLFKSIMFSAQFDTSENTDYVGKIINELNNPVGFMLEEFKGMLERLEGQTTVPVPQTPVAQQEPAPQTPMAQQEPAAPQNPAAQQTLAASQAQGVPQTPVTPQTPKVQQMPAGTQTPPIQNNMPGQNAVPMQNTAPAQNIPLSREQQKPQKKGFGLFGSKTPKEPKQDKKTEKKSEKPDKRANKKAQPMANVAIPGMQQPIPQSQPLPNPQAAPGHVMPGHSMPEQTLHSQTAPAGAQTTMPGSVVPGQSSQPVSVNFGETTVLGGGAAVGETTVLGVNPVPTAQPYLVRIKTDEHIPLTKPVFRIGKEKSYVDYFVSDNSAVSRSHANFVTQNGRYYVIDTNSTNHTFVDNQMIESNVEREITHGMRVRLADEEFEFRAY